MDFLHTIGHEKQKKLILGAIQSGRFSHAYVFVGPENVGKTTFALDLAGILGADPILDLAVFDSEEGLSIEEARTIQGRLSLTPVGKIKVAIISYAEKMTMQAANSLLKVLEEPSAHSLLILITSNFYALLPTVASRLQRVNFGLASEKELRSATADLKLEEEKTEKIVKFSKGRIGLAKKLVLDQKLFDFFVGTQEKIRVLEKGSVVDRLLAAQDVAEMESIEIEKLLKLLMQGWVEKETAWELGQKLLQASRDLKYNLNTKLLLDNLFLA